MSRVPALTDHADAARLARAAGHLLLGIRARATARFGGRLLGDEGDRRANELLVELLGSLHPEDPILSEESADDLRRLDSQRVWVIDPLDGTREFTELDRSDWAVHVALVIDGAPVAAAVGLPAQHQVLSTMIPPTVPAAEPGRTRIVVSRRGPRISRWRCRRSSMRTSCPWAQPGPRRWRSCSAWPTSMSTPGANTSGTLPRRVGVAAAAGLHVSRIDGSPLVYNNPSPWLPDLLICRPELADDVLMGLDRSRDMSTVGTP